MDASSSILPTNLVISNPALHASSTQQMGNNHYRNVTDYEPAEDSILNRSAFSQMNATYSNIVEPTRGVGTASDQRSRFGQPFRDAESQLL